MKEANFGTSRNDSGAALATAPMKALNVAPRRLAFRAGGLCDGPITHLVSPSNIGELIKPFVLLDHAEINAANQPRFDLCPQSAIAKVTLLLSGTMAYEETTGRKGLLGAGGFEWIKPGKGVWHNGVIVPDDVARVFQLWIALPPWTEEEVDTSCRLKCRKGARSA